MRINSGAMRHTGPNGREYMVRMAKAGTPDILGCYKGKFFALEVKLPKTRKNVTVVQSMTIEQIRIAGGIAAVVTSEEEALNLLQERTV